MSIGPPGGTPTGDVTGPASSSDNAVVRWNGITGKLIQNSTSFLSDTGEYTSGNGSAATPTYSFVLDPNSGMYSKGADAVGFSAGGAEVASYDATGFTANNSYVLDGISGSYAGSQEIAKQSGVQTTDATITTLFSVVLAEGEMIGIQGMVNGFRDDFTEAICVRFFASARRETAGNTVLLGLASIEVIEDSTGVPNLTVDADIGTQTIRLRVQGEVAKTFNWVGTYRYFKTLTNA
jgi:hypothetical protein